MNMRLSAPIRRRATAFVVAIVFTYFPIHAETLSCAPRLFTLSEAYEASDAIVVAMVSECAIADGRDTWTSGGDQCTFVTLEVIKDSTPNRDYSGVGNSSGCGLSYSVGGQYLLFLDRLNQPEYFSESMAGFAGTNLLLQKRIETLRNYRDGIIHELPEPWIFSKSSYGHCNLTHTISGNRIYFSYLPSSAVPAEGIDVSQFKVDGRQTVSPDYLKSLQQELRENPDSPLFDRLTMNIDLYEAQQQVVARDVRIRVGNQSWQLVRHDIPIKRPRYPRVLYKYVIDGDVAEEVLSALETRSDVVVKAPREELPEQLIVDQEGEDDVFAKLRRQAEPELGFETRSTGLAKSIADFRSCTGVEH